MPWDPGHSALPASFPSLKCLEKSACGAKPRAVPRLLGAVTAGPAAANAGADEGVRPTAKYVVNFRDITRVSKKVN
jgi:hypothetical protein